MAHRPAHDRRPATRRIHPGRRKPACPTSARVDLGARAAALCAALAIGCAPSLWDAGLWDAGDWARSRPELAGQAVGRLGDATPYVVAADDTLHWFLCRWPLDAPLRVALPPDASTDERWLLARALSAWERAVLGLRFEVVEGEAALQLRFRDDEREGAQTAAVCRVAPPFARAGALDALLVEADIALRRSERDAWGRPRALSAAELVGSAAHEIGHALGLQGHAARGPSVLVREPAAVRRVGERLLEGRGLVEEAAAALYALPSGARVERRALSAGATTAVDAIARRARARGRESAHLQLGDASQRVAWGSDADLVYYLRNPVQLAAGKIEFYQSLVLPVGAPRPAALSRCRDRAPAPSRADWPRARPRPAS